MGGERLHLGGQRLAVLQQFKKEQAYSQQQLPGWEHALAWLPDSFGFSSGVPAICRASGVRWFCTHKLFWNSTNPFPHRVFRWRHASGEDVLALMSAPIGTGGDPLAMAAYSQQWQQSTGIPSGPMAAWRWGSRRRTQPRNAGATAAVARAAAQRTN